MDIPGILGPYCLLVIIYALALFCFGFHMMLPGGSGFALFICWVCGLVGGWLMEIISQPPLLGMLIAGIVLRNIGSPSLVEPLPDEWATAVRVFGLSVILMRSGLELDLGAIKRIGPACVRLTVAPGCSEAIMVGVAGYIIFGMPITLALSLGFILAAVSPAVVVGGMFGLQRRGYGVAKGIPSLVVAAASFDDVVAITGYSLCIGFAISHEGANLLWEAMHGPINVGLGLALGIIGGKVVAFSPMWNTPAKRTLAAGLMGLMMAFFCNMLHFTGAGALASLVSTCVAARDWGIMSAQRGKRADDTDGASEEMKKNGHIDYDEHDDPGHWAHDVESNLAVLWSLVAQPLLFCVIGSALNFAELDPATIPLSCIVIIAGVLVRCPVAMLVLYGADLTHQERAFVGLAWIPKATVQAALGGIPLDIVRTTLDRDHDPEMYDKYEKWGLQILTTAVFSILITAPIGLLVIQNLGHRWLNYDGIGGVAEEETSEAEPENNARGKRDTITMRTEILGRQTSGNSDALELDHVDVTSMDVNGSNLNKDMQFDYQRSNGSQRELIARNGPGKASGSMFCGPCFTA